MPELMNRPDGKLVSSNKQTLLSVFHEDQEIFFRRFIRERLSFCFEGCFEEISDLVGIIKGPEVYCYACDEVIEKMSGNTPSSVIGKDTTKHLESVHGIYQTVSELSE
jgi:hypothetical protein|tara:strand:- start:406 stop:729 length:324 start_codon:yes stop_codon:yes gene_type:complete